jgi:RNA 2',3'-cyclic 3'-phosphodiesterase
MSQGSESSATVSGTNPSIKSRFSSARCLRAHWDVRIFVAVWPDDSVIKLLSAVDFGQTGDLRIVPPEHWHVTLRFLGDVEEALVPTIIESLRDTIGVGHGPLHCVVGPATTWFSRGRVLVLPVAGLDEVAQAVRTATSNVVPPATSGEPPFNGHITLARPRSRLDQSVRNDLTGIRLRATFDVDYLDLVRSELSNEGPAYRTLERVSITVSR